MKQVGMVGICCILIVGVWGTLPAEAQSLFFNPNGLAFTKFQGGPPQSVVLASTNGSGSWKGTILPGDPGSPTDWITISPLSGSISPSTPVTITFTINVPKLPTVATHVILEANPGQAQVHVFFVPFVTPAPAISPNGVVNGASFSTDAVLSPGSIASLFGTNLSSDSDTSSETPLPVTLKNSQVLVNGVAVPLYFVSPNQINFQMPMDLATNPGTSPVSVAVVSNGVTGGVAQVDWVPEVPGIFFARSGGVDRGAVLNQDSSANFDANPALAGSVIQVFVTGLGVTKPPVAAGNAGATVPPFNNTVTGPTALISGLAAPIEFSAMAPGFVGCYQVNIRVPASTPSNPATTLQLQVTGRVSNTVTFAVK